MPTGTGRRRVLAAPLPLLLASLLAACGEEPPETPRDPDADVAEAIERTIRQRERAVARGDRAAFERTLARRDPELLAEQGQYYDNLAQLPLGTVRFVLARRTVERAGNGYWAEVLVHTELQGYDVAPVVTRDRWRFAPARNGRYRLTSTRDPGWEARSGTDPQPWDLGPIEVREDAGVLGIFDPGTVLWADEVLDAVAEGRSDVGSALPPAIEDPGGIVVYVLDDQAFVESIDNLAVPDPELLDGVTVPVPSNPDRARGPVSSYRIVLAPHVLDESEAVLDRLVRHELAHVALGDRARGVPLWLVEGIAEYVSVRPMAPAERRLQTEALDLAVAGVADVPSDEDFAGEHAEGWYGVAWWVCEYVAATYGEAALWMLLEGFTRTGDEQAVVQDQLGITTSELAQAAVGLMRRTYG